MVHQLSAGDRPRCAFQFPLCLTRSLIIAFLLLSFFRAKPGSDDTLTRWARNAGGDTTALNRLLDRCAGMLRNENTAATFPLIHLAQKLCNDMLATLPGTFHYTLYKKLARAYIIEGNLHMFNGAFDKERRVSMAALEIFRKIKHRKGIAIVYNNLGSGCLDRGEYPEAMEYFLDALKTMESIPDTAGIGTLCYSLSDLHKKTGNPRLALHYGLKSLAIKTHLRDSFGIAEGRNSVGTVYYAMEMMDSAYHFFRSALDIADTLDYTEARAHALHNLGNVSLERDHVKESIGYFQQAIDIYAAKGQGIDLCGAVVHLARAYMFDGKYAEARRLFLGNIDSLKKYENHARLENLYEYMVQCDSALGKMTEAIAFAKLWRDQSVENIREQDQGRISEMQVKYDLEKKEHENRVLEGTNRMQSLVLSRNRMLTASLLAMFVTSLAVFIIVWQRNRHRAAVRAATLEQRLLRSQMNPHFIFNSLQAIQNFVMSHKQNDSIRYLESFAQLTRDVLESSRNESVPLEREVRLVENYLTLQKARFGDRFEYTVFVDPSLNPSAVGIPPMLSQPFIENAVEHGLSGMDKDGKLDVRFSHTGEYLEIEITDNGAGMSEDEPAAKSHASRAIRITRERLALLNRNGKKASLDITTANPGQMVNKGVRVNIRLPMVNYQPSE